MHPDWEKFIHSQKGQINQNLVENFGSPQEEFACAMENYGLWDLSHYGLLKITGPKAKSFLQGQLTCDMEKITPFTHSLAAHCDAKGRVLSLFLVFQAEDDYYLLTPQDNLKNALKNLKKYALFDKTLLLQDVSEILIRIGYCGEHAEQHIKYLFGFAPSNAGITQTHEGVSVLHTRSIKQQFILVGSVESIKALWKMLAEHARMAGENSWHALNILSGTPHIYAATSQLFTPHSLNLPELNGVCFSKGCYTGQEIVARMHYLGKVKQKMLGFKTLDTQCLKPGDELLDEDFKTVVGTVVDAVTYHGAQHLLAVVRLDKADKLFTKNEVLVEKTSNPL